MNGAAETVGADMERGGMLELCCKVPASFERVWRRGDRMVEPLYSAVFASVFILQGVCDKA